MKGGKSRERWWLNKNSVNKKIKWIRTQNITCVRKLNSSCPKDSPILFKTQIFGF